MIGFCGLGPSQQLSFTEKLSYCEGPKGGRICVLEIQLAL